MEGLVQIGPGSFLDEGVDKVIQTCRDEAGLSGVIIFTYTWSKSLACRSELPVEGHPRGPDFEFHGGVYFNPRAEYYQDTSIEATRLKTTDAPFKDGDILQQVVGPLRDAGLKVYAALPLGREPQSVHDLAPGFRPCSEVNVLGQPAGEGLPHGWQERPFLSNCYNNPDYRAFYRGLIEDQLRSYGLDGFLVMLDERYGPIEKPLIAGAAPTCFCPHCVSRAKARGIDVDAARAGLLDLHDFAAGARSENYRRPANGHLSSLIALLMRYPEILAWERLWYETVEDFTKDLYTAAKKVRPSCRMGLHVWQVATWGIFARPEMRYQQLAEGADWLKPVLYDKPGGTRLVRTYAQACHKTMLRDLEFEEAVRFLLRLMGQEVPANSQVLEREGLGPGYITRETARVAEAAQGKAMVYPGLGIDVEQLTTGLQYPELSPEDIEAAIRAAEQGGAKGVVLSINYAHMRQQSLRAAGRALSSKS